MFDSEIHEEILNSLLAVTIMLITLFANFVGSLFWHVYFKRYSLKVLIYSVCSFCEVLMAFPTPLVWRTDIKSFTLV